MIGYSARVPPPTKLPMKLPMKLPVKLETSGWPVEPWHVIVAAVVAGVVVAVLLFVSLSLLWRVPPVPEKVLHKRPAAVIALASSSSSWVEVITNGCLFSAGDMSGSPIQTTHQSPGAVRA